MPSAQPAKINGKPLPEHSLQGLVRTFGLLERVMQPYFARFGISGAQWGLLRMLYRDLEAGGDGLRSTDLSDRLLVRPPSVTGVVDRLVRLGLVERTVVLTDTRAKQVKLTDKGKQLVERVMATHREQVEGILNALSVTEQAELNVLLHRLGNHLEQLLEEGWMAAAK